GIMRPGLNAIMGPEDGSRSCSTLPVRVPRSECREGRSCGSCLAFIMLGCIRAHEQKTLSLSLSLCEISVKPMVTRCLSCKERSTGLSGRYFDKWKTPNSANFKCTSGYVPMNDVVLRTVTVRDNIEFSAALRLPMTVTRDERGRRIDEVLELLHLDKKADVKPRSKELEKRTSIAMELVTEHPFLFLDDPTTGLDLKTTIDVISVLRRMSMRGRTIIFSINHPQYFIFKYFDSLTLVASGKVMYHGPAQEALEYFTSAGYECNFHNIPEYFFFLDIINGGFSAILDTAEDGHEVRHVCSWQHQSISEKMKDILRTSYVVFFHCGKLVTGQESVLTLTADSMLSKMDKQNTKERIAKPCQDKTRAYQWILQNIIIFSWEIAGSASIRDVIAKYFTCCYSIQHSSFSQICQDIQKCHYVKFHGFCTLTFLIMDLQCIGEEFLMMQDIDLSSWGFWKNHVALACTIIIFLPITYVQLLALKKKRHV
ncbi:hypothetical protein STEG23_021950, partial [Scotinomys teguina]